jgi:aspartokinase
MINNQDWKVLIECESLSDHNYIEFKIDFNTVLSSSKLELPVGAEVIGFADDTLISITGNDIKQIEKIANKALEKINIWSINVKLSSCNEKTLLLLITHKRKVETPIIKMNNKMLQFVDSFKYLGITLDKRFNFHKHIKI